MSILIKGMEMPKNCIGGCPCYNDELDICNVTSQRIDLEDWHKRKDNCPLIEIPPHGDLIDRSKLAWTPIDITDLPFGECLPVYLKEDVDSAPVVVESEGEDD